MGKVLAISKLRWCGVIELYINGLRHAVNTYNTPTLRNEFFIRYTAFGKGKPNAWIELKENTSL